MRPRHLDPATAPRQELLLKFKADTRSTVSRETVRALAVAEGVSETQLIHRALAEFRERSARRKAPVAKPLLAMAAKAEARSPRPQRQRPQSLREAALQGRAHGHLDASLREFLDEFYVATDAVARARMLSEEPPLGDDARANAYLAAVAEHLALRSRLPVPEWTAGAQRFLRRPFFPGGLESLKATLLKESPVAFRRRLIFVDADPLHRPRRNTAGAAIGAAP